jgi:hypothetical protein
VLIDEKAAGVILTKFKSHLDEAKSKGMKEQGKSDIKAVQAMTTGDNFKALGIPQLKLLSDISLAAVRKIELPGMIDALETELEELKEIRVRAKAKVKLEKAKEEELKEELKEAALDEKKKQTKKRELDAVKPSPRKK